MPTSPPTNPDIRRQLRTHLYALSPRAFELFAGELLSFVGLRHVEVTRYSGDGGIDAHGDLISVVCAPGSVTLSSLFRDLLVEARRGRDFGLFETRDAAMAWLGQP